MQASTLHHHRGHNDHAMASAPTSLSVVGDTINQAGQTSNLHLMLKRGDGTAIKDFATTHDEKVHLAVVRNGLDTFAHLHPEIFPDGTWVVPYTFPVGGSYRVYADFKPNGEAHSTASTIIHVPGESPPAPDLQVNAPGRVRGEAWIADITLEMGTDAEGSILRFELMDAKGQPIQDLKPYMGARGHLQIISADGKE